jgi:hypothetical protein
MKYFPLTLCAVAALAACDAQTARPRTEPGIAGGFMPAATQRPPRSPWSPRSTA